MAFADDPDIVDANNDEKEAAILDALRQAEMQRQIEDEQRAERNRELGIGGPCPRSCQKCGTKCGASAEDENEAIDEEIVFPQLPASKRFV